MSNDDYEDDWEEEYSADLGVQEKFEKAVGDGYSRDASGDTGWESFVDIVDDVGCLTVIGILVLFVMWLLSLFS